MKKLILFFAIFIGLFASAQIDRFPDGFYIQPKTTFPSSPIEGQFHYDDITNIAYFYDGTQWVSMAADSGDIITIENIAPLVLETYIIDLQNGNDADGQYQNGAKPFLTLQAALDDAEARNFADYKNINFRINGTGTAYITKKHSNINCNFIATDGANISYENYVPIGGDLVVLEGNIDAALDDRKAQLMHFQYYTEGEVIFGNNAGDNLDFGRGFDLTIEASKITGKNNFSFGKVQILNIDVLETEWNSISFTGDVGALSDERIRKLNVHWGDITINTVTNTFQWGISNGYDINLSFKSITSNTLTGLNFIGISNYVNSATYKIGSVIIPNLSAISSICQTDVELTIDVSNVQTWSDNMYLTFFDNQNITFTGKGDFTASSTPLARYRLKLKDADIKIGRGVIVNQTSIDEIGLLIENSNIEYSNNIIERSGTIGNYNQPNIKIKGIVYIENTGVQNDIFDAVDPASNYNQAIEIDGKLITYNCTYDGSGSNSGTPNPNITVNQHITQESNINGSGGSTSDASSLTSGVLADARVQQSNVTQHESAINALNLANAPAESGATNDQTGNEIVAAIDSELGQTTWKTGGVGSGNPVYFIVDEASDLSGDLSIAQNKIISVQGGTIDLSNENITLPSNTYLRFDGGYLINGTIDLNGGQMDSELIDYRMTYSNGSLKDRKYIFNKAKAGITEATTDSLICESNKARWNFIGKQVHDLDGNHIRIKNLDATFSVYSDTNNGTIQWDNGESLELWENITYENDDTVFYRCRADNAWGASFFNTSRQDNITFIGGNIIGDRPNHDYSIPLSDPTRFSHEFGSLFNIVGSHNVNVIGVVMEKPTADCIIVDGTSIRNPDGTLQPGERESRNILLEGLWLKDGRRNTISILDGVQITINNCDIEGGGAGYNFDPHGTVGPWGRLPMNNLDLEAFQATNTNNSSQSLKYEDDYLIRITNNRFKGSMKGDINCFKGWRILIDNNYFTNTLNNQFANDNTFSNNTLIWDESLRQGREDSDAFSATGGQTSYTLQYTAMPVGTFFEDFYITVNGTELLEITDYTISSDRTTVNFVNALSASDAVVIEYFYEQPTRVRAIGVNDALTVHAGGNFSQVFNIDIHNNTIRGYDIGLSLNGNGTKAKYNYVYDFTYAGIVGGGTKNNVFVKNHIESNVEGVYGIENQNTSLEVIYDDNKFIIPNGSFCQIENTNEGSPYGNVRINLGEIGNTLDDLTVDGVSIISGVFTVSSTNETTTAGQIVSDINSHTSTPNYTASNAGNTITIFHEDAANDAGEFFEVVATTTGMNVATANFIKSPRNNIITMNDNKINCRDAGTIQDTYGLHFIDNKTNVGLTGFDWHRFRINKNESTYPLQHSFIDLLYNLKDSRINNNDIEVNGDETIHVNGIDNRGAENNEIIGNTFRQTGGADIIRFQRGEEENINNLIFNNRFIKDASQDDIDIVGTNNKIHDNYSKEHTLSYSITGVNDLRTGKELRTGTSATIELTGRYLQDATANSATNYVVTSTDPFNIGKIRINAVSEPTMNGSSVNKKGGVDFVANTDMWITFIDMGSRIEYFFTEY